MATRCAKQSQKTSEAKIIKPVKIDEIILVVPKSDLFKKEIVQGLSAISNFAEYVQVIEKHKKFIARSEAELDLTYKQIIPYLVFSFQDKYFLMQRQSTASETRLKSKYSFGIGGHIREEDITGSDMMGWAAREFAEEVEYSGSYTIIPLGLLNDERDAVGQVHTGFVFLLKGNSDAISVKSELKTGELLTLEECKNYYDGMETWSQYIFDFLTNNRTKF
ncbi:MAG: hypothetical protein ABH827_01400 [bacterium]